ncbi:META domain-containing protein [Tenacibaculum sp. L6]|uniref:META domain-containing protein n=1 Tax=Tenacibaculum sp. L6 TaxID=2992764 RepID=UPI00237A32F8|nr:META domain-containing protein [Tenacibaculum sp. L6]MDE0535482.1 META domain-containing protein [Tenacibaculum sp. L6]
MKKVGLLLPIIVSLVLQSCGSLKNTGSTEEVFWVSSIKTECSAGAGKMNCLNVYKGNNIAEATWELFYAPIEGFTFEEGTLQKIKVKVERLNPKDVPADASSLKYTLIETIETQVDIRTHLAGEWNVTSLYGKELNEETYIPSLIIDLHKNRISGNNSCNNYTAQITNATSQSLTLGAVATTRKMCFKMDVANSYNKALEEINTYLIKGNNLIFFTKEGEKIVSFTKLAKKESEALIDGNWIAVRIEGAPINRMVKTPRIKISLEEMRLSGNNGCNDYTTQIKEISDSKIKIGHIAATQKMCRDMQVGSDYLKMLQSSVSFKVKDNSLKFYNKESVETILFLKVKK